MNWNIPLYTNLQLDYLHWCNTVYFVTFPEADIGRCFRMQ